MQRRVSATTELVTILGVIALVLLVAAAIDQLASIVTFVVMR